MGMASVPLYFSLSVLWVYIFLYRQEIRIDILGFIADYTFCLLRIDILDSEIREINERRIKSGNR